MEGLNLSLASTEITLLQTAVLLPKAVCLMHEVDLQHHGSLPS